jgi:flagellar basal body rod protein FlgG
MHTTHSTHSLAIAASALAAQSTKTGVIAANVANATTAGYSPRFAVLVPLNPGVAVSAIKADDESEDDPAVPFTDLILARNAYEAALKIFATSAAMSYELLRTI